jgi:hypothetical protein
MANERKVDASFLLWTCVGVTTVLAVFVLVRTGTSTRQVSGNVVTYMRTQSETGGVPMLVVELADGTDVRVRIGNGVPVHYGAEVILTEIETQLFGFRRYNFVGYARASSESKR